VTPSGGGTAESKTSPPPQPAGEGHAPPATTPAPAEGHTPPVTKPPAGEGGHVTPSPSTLRSGIRIVGGLVAATAVGFLRQWFDEWLLEQQLNKLKPKILDEIDKHAARIAEFRSRGDRVFANVTIQVMQQTMTDMGDPDVGPIEVTSSPIAKVISVWVSGKDINDTRDESSIAMRTQLHDYTYSVELDIPEDEIATFRALMMLWKRNQEQLRQNPADAELQKEEARLRALLGAKLGPFADYEVLEVTQEINEAQAIRKLLQSIPGASAGVLAAIDYLQIVQQGADPAQVLEAVQHSVSVLNYITQKNVNMSAADEHVPGLYLLLWLLQTRLEARQRTLTTAPLNITILH